MRLNTLRCTALLPACLHACMRAWAWHRWCLCASHRLSVLTSTVLPVFRSIAAIWHALCSSSSGRRSSTRSGQSDRIASVGLPPKRIVVGLRAPALRSPSYSARVFPFFLCTVWYLRLAWPSAKLLSASVRVCGSITFASSGAALAFPSLLLKQRVHAGAAERKDEERTELLSCNASPAESPPR